MKRRTWGGVAAAMLALTLAVAGCGGQSAGQSDGAAGEAGKVTVYTTVYPLYYAASRIGGAYADVRNVVPAGVEPHDFEPTAKDVVAMSDAKVIVYNGSGLDAWVEKALQGFDTSKVVAVNATDGLPLLKTAAGAEEGHAGETAAQPAGGDHGDARGMFDPHVWLDPALFKQQAEKVKDALVKADGAHRQAYEQNYGKLAADLDALDQAYRQMAAQARHKEFLVSHAAFGYLAHRYGLKQVAISGISPADEPSPAELKELVEHVKAHGIHYVLFETLVSPKVAETIARETGAGTATLNPLEGLTEDEEKAGKDYLSIMRENLETLRRALSD